MARDFTGVNQEGFTSYSWYDPVLDATISEP